MDELTIEELQKQLEEEKKRAEALALSKQRLEEESKKYKSRAQQAEEKLSQAEREKLEKEGNLEQLLEAERKRAMELESKLNSRTNLVLSEKLKASLAMTAKDAHNVDLLLSLPEAKEFLQIDEESLTVAGVEDFVKTAREKAPYLFKKAKVPTGETTPPNGGTNNDESGYLKELREVTTREQLIAVKKKYGKL